MFFFKAIFFKKKISHKNQTALHFLSIDHLKKTKGTIAVVAIAGVYRTGKSYVLNRILGRSNGFEIGGTVNACTKGIYIWGSPMTITNGDGEKVTMILVDTEGIGSIEQNATHDAKILSLSVILNDCWNCHSEILISTISEKI